MGSEQEHLHGETGMASKSLALRGVYQDGSIITTTMDLTMIAMPMVVMLRLSSDQVKKVERGEPERFARDAIISYIRTLRGS